MVNYENAVMQELQALQRIYKKIEQVVRIRKRFHGKREAELLIILQKMQATSHLQGEEHTKALQAILNTSDQEISALRNLLRQEKRIFRFIESKERSADRIISDAMAQLKSQKRQIRESVGKTITLKDGRKIPVSDLQNFLRKVHRFLTNLKRDIHRIRKRMAHEDKFLHSRDVSHFHKFLREWDNEVKAFKRMLNDLKKVVRIAPDFVREMSVPQVGSSLGKAQDGSSLDKALVGCSLVVGSILGTVAHTAHDAITLTDGVELIKAGVEMDLPTAAVVGISIGACILCWSFITEVWDSLTSEDTAWDVTRERRILSSMINAFR